MDPPHGPWATPPPGDQAGHCVPRPSAAWHSCPVLGTGTLAPTARTCERAAAAAASRDLLGRGAAAPFPPASRSTPHGNIPCTAYNQVGGAARRSEVGGRGRVPRGQWLGRNKFGSSIATACGCAHGRLLGRRLLSSAPCVLSSPGAAECWVLLGVVAESGGACAVSKFLRPPSKTPSAPPNKGRTVVNRNNDLRLAAGEPHLVLLIRLCFGCGALRDVGIARRGQWQSSTH